MFWNWNLNEVYIYFENYVIHEMNSMSDLFIWIYSGGGGLKFMKHLKEGARYKILVPSNVA
jgi:hypothetical protein